MANTALLKPTTVEAVVDEQNPNLAVITLEPFERGYGHTLGNALRRILLSSMVGYAPTEAQIVGVVHEYSQIDGVIEDVVDILLNLKGVVFKLEGGREDVMLRLQKSGMGPVTAGDFDLPHDVTVLNPDHVIANLSGGKLDLQVRVETGRGYQPGDVRAFRDDYSKQTIGRIIMDASFSPVRRVAYSVSAARVAQRTDLDKLEMTIETNGVISRKTHCATPCIFCRISSPCSEPSRPMSKPNSSRRKKPRRRSIRSSCARLTISNSRFAAPTA